MRLVQAFRSPVIVNNTIANVLALGVAKETDTCRAAMRLFWVAGAPNYVDPATDGVDRKAVAGKFTVDEVCSLVIILW